MNDTAKYLIRATIATDGVVERSDVVGAVFGQTEGLLGDELDLRDLQESSKVGRINVSIRSENGQSFGEVTVASSLDKVETAILAASLETIDRIGPCGAAVEVTSIEDVRAAKRREVVERAKELVASGFEETSLGSDDVLEEVREAARVTGIVDYEGLPAGPRVGDSDAVIIVEGRADVSTLLECGIKNAVAVEGTNVPDAVADLTTSRTVTAFLDGDRGGELILRELAQVGEIEYVAFAPPGESVEDLDRASVFDALRGKVPYETLADEPNLRDAAGQGTTSPASSTLDDTPSDTSSIPDDAEAHTAVAIDTDDLSDDPSDGSPSADDDGDFSGDDEAHNADDGADTHAEADVNVDENRTDTGESTDADIETELDETEPPVDQMPRSFEEHVQEVVDGDSGRARLLDGDLGVRTEVEATDAFDAVAGADEPPVAVVLDGTIDQRLVDVAAQRGVGKLFGRDTGDLVKRPVGTQIVTVADRAVEA
jgi:DNA primase